MRIAVVSLLGACAACAACAACGGAMATADAGAGDDDGGKGDGSAAQTCDATALVIEIHAGSTHKLAQLTGDTDRELGAPTASQTLTRYGLWGTDLGASFAYGGRTYFLFGDSIPTGAGTPNAAFGDAIASTADTDASDGLALDFVTHEDGTFRSPVVPGVDLGEYDVPLDGIEAGGAMYVWFSTGRMTRSVLARSDDAGASFAFVHELSANHFVNVSAVKDGGDVLLFGSGAYRASEVFLAKVGQGAIEDRGAYRFYAGLEADGCTPRWSAEEAAAVPLFGPACVGELSAHFVPELGAYAVLYNCGEPRGIQARVARTPTGPWSEQATVFDPWADGGYCHFMHTSWQLEHCDSVQDPGRDDDWGGEYGPYVVESLTQAAGVHAAALTFALSTWNPYNTVLVQTELGWH